MLSTIVRKFSPSANFQIISEFAFGAGWANDPFGNMKRTRIDAEIRRIAESVLNT